MGGRLGTLWSVKVAVTLGACVMLTVHVPVPLHPAPLQPPNIKPVSAVAVSVTLVVKSKGALHVMPQSIPAGLLVTVPLPVPAFTTFRVNCTRLKVAVTVCAWVILTVHVPVPLHPSPLQPANVEPGVATAVSVTLVPKSKGALHVM